MLDQLLDALGYAGSALNKPGRAVRGLLAGKGNEALAALPFSDSLGLTDESNNTTGKELLSHLGLDPGEGVGGDLAGFGAEVATDPLTFAGGALGRMLGKSADAAQVARGPRYGTTAEDLIGMAKGAPEFNTPLMEGVSRPMVPRPGGGSDLDVTEAGQKVRELLGSPHAARLLGEIHPQSTMLGTGAEGMALRQPSGDVLRLGLVPPAEKGRPVSDTVNAVTRSVDVPNDRYTKFRVERSPFADHVDDAGYWVGDGGPTAPLAQLDEAMRGQGLRRGDRHLGNVGVVDGRQVVIDPGAVDTLASFAGGRAPVTPAAEPSLLMRALLSGVGGDEALQRSLARGGNDPGLARKLAMFGAAEGAATGAASRSKR